MSILSLVVIILVIVFCALLILRGVVNLVFLYIRPLPFIFYKRWRLKYFKKLVSKGHKGLNGFVKRFEDELKELETRK